MVAQEKIHQIFTKTVIEFLLISCMRKRIFWTVLASKQTIAEKAERYNWWPWRKSCAINSSQIDLWKRNSAFLFYWPQTMPLDPLQRCAFSPAMLSRCFIIYDHCSSATCLPKNAKKKSVISVSVSWLLLALLLNIGETSGCFIRKMSLFRSRFQSKLVQCDGASHEAEVRGGRCLQYVAVEFVTIFLCAHLHFASVANQTREWAGQKEIAR